MAGWDKKEGKYNNKNLSDDEIWIMFNSILSNKSRNKTSYKYGFLKAVLDNIFNVDEINNCFISYEDLFSKFAENYWNLIVKYGIKQIIQDSRNVLSGIEKIFLDATISNPILIDVTFDSIEKDNQKVIINKVEKQCKKYVVGAIFVDSNEYFYDFDLRNDGIYLNPCIYEFLLKYKIEIEKINYYEWARFLENINKDDVLVKVLEKLDISTKRKNLSIYRIILQKEFEQNNCFYCGKKLGESIHVDHFIPWSFVKDDKLWNFVLSCSSCNIKKSNKIVLKEFLGKLKERNNKILLEKNSNYIISKEFKHYNDEVLSRMWKYAKFSGLDEVEFKFKS